MDKHEVCPLYKPFLFQKGNNLPLLLLHPPRLGLSAPFMVIPGKVEDAVQKQKMEPGDKGYSPLFRFPGAGYGRNNHIPQNLGVHPREESLLHGKRDDVSGVVAPQIEPVEAVDAAVADDGERQFAIGISQGA
jgi:hypothetical protein